MATGKGNGASIHEFAPDILLVDGPIVRDFGFPFPTRMAVIRLRNGSLWIDSPVPVSTEILTRIQALGPVLYLVAPTPRHVWRLREAQLRFPKAELWACRQIPAKLRHLPVTGILGSTVPEAWAADLDQLVFRGNPLLEEVCFFHARSRTLIMDDLIQHHLKEAGKPLRNALLTLVGSSGSQGEVPLDIRWSFWDRTQARHSLEQLLAWDFDRLVIAHGPCIECDAKAVIEHAFHWLQS